MQTLVGRSSVTSYTPIKETQQFTHYLRKSLDMPHGARDDVQRTLTLYVQGHGNDSDVPQQPTARQQQALLHFGNVAVGPAPDTRLAGLHPNQVSLGELRTMPDGGEEVRGSLFTLLRNVAVPTCLGQDDRELIAEVGKDQAIRAWATAIVRFHWLEHSAYAGPLPASLSHPPARVLLAILLLMLACRLQKDHVHT